jgi:uncharacterized protein YegL
MSNDDLEERDADQGSTATRFPVVLLLDVSGSMEKSGALAELNRGAQALFDAIRADPRSHAAAEVAILAFAGKAAVVLPFTNPVPRRPPPLMARLNGALPEGTDLGAAVGQALALLEKHQAELRKRGSFYRPLLVLLTDGLPQSRALPKELVRAAHLSAAACRRKAEASELTVVALGVGPRADLDALAPFTPAGEPPRRLDTAHIDRLFRLVSSMMVGVSTGRVRREAPLDLSWLPTL